MSTTAPGSGVWQPSPPTTLPPPQQPERTRPRSSSPSAYVVVRTYYKDSSKAAGASDTDPAAALAPTADKSLPEPVAAAVPTKVFPPIPDDEQCRAYKWILEKRKVKPRDKAEKRKLDDEKALLKQIIRAESLPRL